MPMIGLRSGGYYALELRDVRTSQPRPFEDVRADVLADWRLAERRRAIEEQAAALLARVEGGESLPAAAEALGLTARRSIGLTREGVDIDLPPRAIAQAFEAEADAALGQAFEISADGGRRRVVAQVAEIIDADPTAAAAELSELRESSARSMQFDLINLYAQAVIDDLGQRIYPDELETAATAPLQIGGGGH